MQTVLRLLTGNQNRQGGWLVPALLAVLVSVFLSVRTANFLGPENLLNLLAQALPLIITAVGQMFVVVVGGLLALAGAVTIRAIR